MSSKPPAPQGKSNLTLFGKKENTRSVYITQSFDYIGRNSVYSKQYFRKGPHPTLDREKVVYTHREPGNARGLELILEPEDPRVGIVKYHNTDAIFNSNLEIKPTMDFEPFEKFHSIEYLMLQKYQEISVVTTKKRLDLVYNNFKHLNYLGFMEMINYSDPKIDKRDFDVVAKKVNEYETRYAVIHPDTKLVKFIQIIRRNKLSEVDSIIHINFDAGIAVSVNESYVDKDGNLRNYVHLGITGAASNSRRSGIERFNDGTVIWTVSAYKRGRYRTGAAALRPDGSVVLMRNSQDLLLAQTAARDIGAEQVNPVNQSWTGRFSPDSCVPEANDRYVIRREYKTSIRKQCFSLVDGSCIPGLIPIFDVKL
jgi:hypothetical protein